MSKILLARLLEYVDADTLFSWDGQVYRPEHVRAVFARGIVFNREDYVDAQSPWTREQHLGRVAFLMTEPKLEPVVIVCEDLGPVVKDGLHRLMASVVRDEVHVRATFTGPKNVEDYLVGKRHKKPE